MQLQIHHLGEQDGKSTFTVKRLVDGKQTAPVVLTSPEQTQVEGRPESNLQQDLRWYLEQFLELPLGAYLDTAERVQASLQQWGEACFAILFQKQAYLWFSEARDHGLEQLTLKISSNDPQVLSWPWEALSDPEGGLLAQHCRIERQLNELRDPLPLPDNLPQERINILLVIARPYGDNDVGFHALSRPLIELTKVQNSPVTIDVLRPPTFDQLRQVLHDKSGYYHIVHFDGHGGYGTPGHSSPHASPHVYKGLQGMLIFEDEQAEPTKVEAHQLSELMAEHRIPIMVLNACQSAKIDEQADDAFASVAAALLKAGIRSVVAMGYNLYVSGAQRFVPAFYQRLLNSGDVAEAARAGRQAMLAHPERVCVMGEHPLQDWLVPVLYQQLPAGETVLPDVQGADIQGTGIPGTGIPFSFPESTNATNAITGSATTDRLPDEVQTLGDYGFIGRERAIQALERARLQQPQAGFLIHGMAGVGKTTLAKGFLYWLHDTNGLSTDLPNGGVFWFSFDEIRSAEYVINEMVDALFGTNARAATLEQRLDALVQTFAEHPFLLIWDNFESASGIAGTDVTALLAEQDRALLKTLLKRLRSGKTKILITSRSPESWLTQQECYRLPLSGLQGEELWEYCNAVVRDLGLSIDRRQEAFEKLMTELDGHPLAIRAILLRLPQRSAADLLAGLQQEFAGQQGDDSTWRIGAALQLFDQGLPEGFAPTLQLIGLHERFVVSGGIEDMLKASEDHAALSQLTDCFAALETAGLLHLLGGTIYRMHPALRSYLSQRHKACKVRQRAFVDFMGSYADFLAPKALHEQRIPFALHQGNFHHALALAQTLPMNQVDKADQNVAALTQSLAAYAHNTRDYVTAIRLFEHLAEHYKRHKDADGEATVYHQLGVVAQEQRDYVTAQKWYRQSLAIKEKQGNEQDAASTYHQLGSIAEEQRDYAKAEQWYKQSLAINEKLGNEHGAAITYHQLGIFAEEQRDYAMAEKWYRQSLAIKEKLGNEHGAAMTYHQLGIIAQEQSDYAMAEKWYKQSLVIKEKQGNERGAASTYHQLGVNAQQKCDYTTAEKWYKQSLAIEEKLGDQHGAASTYHQLGIIAQYQSDYATAEKWFKQALAIWEYLVIEHHAASTCAQLGLMAEEVSKYEEAGQWFIRAVSNFASSGDEHNAGRAIQDFWRILQAADPAAQATLQECWQQAGLDNIITLKQLEQQLNDQT